MSYVALYRKYRPKKFQDVVGQDHIVRTLKNQITADRISHAYLFCGTRGTGKTSIAKIFAKVVNCESLKDGEACGECVVCNEIELARSMNIIEIDAASNNGVDNIREIREEVRYAPTQGKYKVYIIDEVHMLSTGAFNALLKTLEEPPSHVIFILATTDPQKIPVTILSRCQRFDFRRITQRDIKSKLGYYMSLENLEVEDEALSYISYLADGGMRDALSILDQCISFYFGETITLEKVLKLLGAVDKSVFFKLVNAINDKNSKQVMEICEEINIQGRDIRQFVLDSIVHFRDVLVAKSSSGTEGVLEYEKGHIEKLVSQGASIEAEVLMRYIRVFSDLEIIMKGSTKPRILLEVALLKLCEPAMEISYDSVLDRIASLEKKVKEGVTQVVYKKETVEVGTEQAKELEPKPMPKAVPEDIKKLVGSWGGIKNNLSPSLKNLMDEVGAGYLEDDVLYLIFPNSGLLKVIKENNQDIVQDAVQNSIGKIINTKYVTLKEYEMSYKEIYGPNPSESPETKDIESIIDMLKQMIEFPIQVE